ncbi:MAG: DNA polymerase IV [Bacteriovoracaceae bacterium]|nr:DNA polymerase IV [Bacteroidota bacterium]
MERQKKYIAHIDLDCFFVSVERIKDHSLIGKPAAVGGTGRRGVISSASYEARKFGVRSAMPTVQALDLCPQLIVVHGSHDEYGRVSKQLYKFLCDYAPIVQQASIDEMYMDFTGCEKLYNNDLPGLMRTLQALVKKEFSLPCTIALSSNKVVSKIATGCVKPEGCITIEHGLEKEFLSPLNINVIPGVGAKTEQELRKYDINLIRDLQKMPKEMLESMLGDHGGYFHRVAMGIGNDRLEVAWKRKSISSENTFSKDTSNTEELLRYLYDLTETVCHNTRRYGWKGKTVKLKLRYSDFSTITRNITLKESTNDDKVVFDAVKGIFLKTYLPDGALDARRAPIRLLGVGLTQFSEAKEEPMSLFPEDEKRTQVLRAVDKLKKKFGDDAIHTGAI